MAIESPSDAGWAALGFGSSMIGSTAVIATTTAAAGGVGVFTLGQYSAAAITEVQGAVDASAGRRLSNAGPAFTITDVRTPPTPAVRHAGTCNAGMRARSAQRTGIPHSTVSSCTPNCVTYGKRRRSQGPSACLARPGRTQLVRVA